MDPVYTLRFDTSSAGPAVAIKDLIDMAGVPTTAGCRAVADRAVPAAADAACLEGIRAAEGSGALHLTGKTNLHELAFGITGINGWSGTPQNPLGSGLVPGGSSSGSAVAVGRGEAYMALGTDTGGSIRIPAACCGVAGLKTTFGRISVEGIRPLAPVLDTVGPLAAGVEGLAWGMELLEPGFAPASGPADRVARFSLPAVPAVDEAIDRVLADAGLTARAIEIEGWDQASADTMKVIAAGAFESDGYLLADGMLGDDVAGRLEQGRRVLEDEGSALPGIQQAWRREMAALLETVGLIVSPTLSDFPPRIDQAGRMYSIRQTHPVNLAGVPALSLPVPTTGPLPASLQLIGPAGSEELLLATGLLLEQAAGYRSG